jgi:hypothetical protein
MILVKILNITKVHNHFIPYEGNSTLSDMCFIFYRLSCKIYYAPFVQHGFIVSMRIYIRFVFASNQVWAANPPANF